VGSAAPPRICLVGARGSGKTTIGAALARRLGVPFLDGDAAVARAAGRDVARLLEAGDLRAWEARVLPDLLAAPLGVLATGGGAVLWAGFAEACRGWRVLWLDAPPDVLARRIEADPTARPSLTGAGPAADIARVASEREPLYASVAERRFDTGRDDPRAIVEAIVVFLDSMRNEAPRPAD